MKFQMKKTKAEMDAPFSVNKFEDLKKNNWLFERL